MRLIWYLGYGYVVHCCCLFIAIICMSVSVLGLYILSKILKM